MHGLGGCILEISLQWEECWREYSEKIDSVGQSFAENDVAPTTVLSQVWYSIASIKV